MTTDIKELPLLVSKAKASLFTLEYISQFEPADIDADDVDLRFEVDGRNTGTNVSIVDECGQAARVIGALIEALEAKDAECHRLSDELRGATALVTLMKIDAREFSRELEAKDARIAELETYIEIHESTALAAIERAEMADRRAVELQSRAEAAEKCLSNLAAVSRRYLPDYDEHPEIQAADDLLEQNSLTTAGTQTREAE